MVARSQTFRSRAGYRSARPVTSSHHCRLATRGRSIHSFGHPCGIAHHARIERDLLPGEGRFSTSVAGNPLPETATPRIFQPEYEGEDGKL